MPLTIKSTKLHQRVFLVPTKLRAVRPEKRGWCSGAGWTALRLDRSTRRLRAYPMRRGGSRGRKSTSKTSAEALRTPSTSPEHDNLEAGESTIPGTTGDNTRLDPAPKEGASTFRLSPPPDDSKGSRRERAPPRRGHYPLGAPPVDPPPMPPAAAAIPTLPPPLRPPAGQRPTSLPNRSSASPRTLPDMLCNMSALDTTGSACQSCPAPLQLFDLLDVSPPDIASPMLRALRLALAHDSLTLFFSWDSLLTRARAPHVL